MLSREATKNSIDHIIGGESLKNHYTTNSVCHIGKKLQDSEIFNDENYVICHGRSAMETNEANASLLKWQV